MARNLKKYMELNGKDRSEICHDLDIKYTTLADWLNGKTYPRIDKIERLANYFHISKADLVEGPPEQDYYINDDTRELAEFLFNNPRYKVLFDASRKVKEEDIDFVRQMIDRMRGNDDDTSC